MTDREDKNTLTEIHTVTRQRYTGGSRGGDDLDQVLTIQSEAKQGTQGHMTWNLNKHMKTITK